MLCREYPLVIALVAASGGVFVSKYFPLTVSIYAASVVFFACGWYLATRFQWRGHSIWALLIIASLFAAWHHWRWHYYPADEIGLSVSEEASPICLRAHVISVPQRIIAPPEDPFATMQRGPRTRFRLRVCQVRDGTVWRQASGKVSAVVNEHLYAVGPGDVVEVYGRIRRPNRAMNPGEFCFYSYERAYRRLARLWLNDSDSVQVLKRPATWNPRWWLLRLRQYGQAQFEKYLPASQSDLASAILLGERDRLDRRRIEPYFMTGTIHLLTISGLHLGILAGGFFVLARRTNFVPDRPVLWLIVVLAIFYALLTGARPPVMRATTLIVIVCLGTLWHREGRIFNSLAAAGLVVLTINPAQLFMTGTMLSFLAVSALAWLALSIEARRTPPDPLDVVIARTRPQWHRTLREWTRRAAQLLIASTAIWLFAMPLVMHQFHIATPVAIPLNVLLCLPISLSLFSGLVVLVFGGWMPPIAKLAAWICDTNLQLIETTVQSAAQVPGGFFWVAGPPRWLVVAFYGGAALIGLTPVLRRHQFKSMACLLVFFGTAYAISSVRSDSPDELRCTFLAIGHGTASVLELPTGQVMLYDAGAMKGPQVSSTAIAGFLWSRGITHLDAIVLSHADADHFNGVPILLDRFRTDRIYASAQMFAGRSGGIVRLRQRIETAGIPICEVSAGDLLVDDRASGLCIEILHPPSVGVAGSDNANSLVLRVEYNGRSLLLPGDLEEAGMERLLGAANIHVDVAMAPHHGSLRSQPDRFIDWCRPEQIVVSAGRHRDERRQTAVYVDAGCEVYRTNRLGAIQVSIENGLVDVRPVR